MDALERCESDAGARLAREAAAAERRRLSTRKLLEAQIVAVAECEDTITELHELVELQKKKTQMLRESLTSEVERSLRPGAGRRSEEEGSGGEESPDRLFRYFRPVDYVAWEADLADIEQRFRKMGGALEEVAAEAEELTGARTDVALREGAAALKEMDAVLVKNRGLTAAATGLLAARQAAA